MKWMDDGLIRDENRSPREATEFFKEEFVDIEVIDHAYLYAGYADVKVFLPPSARRVR